MGDPKKQRKKYSTPTHPWQGARIEEEGVLSREYGLKNKKEIWKMDSILRNFTRQAKKLIASQTNQAEIERKQLLEKSSSLGLIAKTAKVEDVLSLTLKDILERRLQTLTYRKQLARSAKQARQFVVHKHIAVGAKSITTPSYLVSVEEEPMITFVQSSSISSPDHPERVEIKKAIPEKKSKEEKSSKKEKKPKKKKSQEKDMKKKEEKQKGTAVEKKDAKTR